MIKRFRIATDIYKYSGKSYPDRDSKRRLFREVRFVKIWPEVSMRRTAYSREEFKPNSALFSAISVKSLVLYEGSVSVFKLADSTFISLCHGDADGLSDCTRREWGVVKT